MQQADFKVVLDACVLANFSVCDLLLTLAEKPRMYLPRWSQKLLDETYDTHVKKLGWEKKIADTFQNSLHEAFPEALVEDFEHLIDKCQNQEKDRHVLACAIHCKSELLLTFNLSDFPEESRAVWQINALHPQDYLLTLYDMNPALVIHKLETIARKRNKTLEDQLIKLGTWLPSFSHRMLSDLNETT